MRQTYGKQLPGMWLTDLPGKLIVIEGTDGAGRSTQINLLKPWLEEKDLPVLRLGKTVVGVEDSDGKTTVRGELVQSNGLAPLSVAVVVETDKGEETVVVKLVDGRGFEPPTPALRTRCSPN